jgi:hypothetical protein
MSRLAAAWIALALSLGLAPARRLAAQAEPGAIDAAAGLPAGWSILPPLFFPGDLVELRVPLGPGWRGGEALAPESSETLEIVSAELRKGASGSSELRIKFIAWKPGAFSLPAFGAGGASFGPIDLKAGTFVGASGRGLAPPRRPLLLPGTRMMIALAFAALALAILGSFAFVSFAMPWLERVRRAREARRPYARFSHDLRVALRRSDDSEARIFYGYLSQAFRRYARARLARGADSLTPLEIAQRGGAALGGGAAALSGILARSDSVRFGGDRADPPKRRADALALARIVAGMEAERAGL